MRLDNHHILNVEGSVKLLGIHLDTSLTFDGHISMVLSQCYSLIRNIAKMRKLLAIDALKKLINAVIISRLDYCNALFYGISSYNVKRLQLLQNAAAKFI